MLKRLFIVVGAFVATMGSLQADPPRAAHYPWIYSSGTERTVSGKVEEVDVVPGYRGWHQVIELTVKTSTGVVRVHVGPAWFVDDSPVQIEVGDQLTIRGSYVTADGNGVLLAAEIRKDGAVLQLRDEHGFPLWSGWRRGRAGNS